MPSWTWYLTQVKFTFRHQPEKNDSEWTDVVSIWKLQKSSWLIDSDCIFEHKIYDQVLYIFHEIIMTHN